MLQKRLPAKKVKAYLSLEFWQERTPASFLVREGHFSEDMELIAEEFEVVEVL